MNEQLKPLDKHGGMTIGQELKLVKSGENVGRFIKMNERIRELANEAWRYADLHSSDGDGRHGHLYRDKFAELIVRECADRVSGSVVRDKGYIPQDPHSQGWNDAVAYAGKELKKYFGVE